MLGQRECVCVCVCACVCVRARARVRACVYLLFTFPWYIHDVYALIQTYFWLHDFITIMTGNIGEVIYHDQCHALVMPLFPVSSFSHMKIRHVLWAWHCTPTLPDNDNNALLQPTSHTTWQRAVLCNIHLPLTHLFAA